MTTGDPGWIKGAALHGFVSWYQDERDAETLRRAHQRLPLTVKRYLDPARPAMGVTAGSWYPAAVVHGMLDGVTAELDAAATEALAHEAATRIFERNMPGILRPLFRMFVSPTMVKAMSQLLWDVYYDSGRVTVSWQGRTAQRMQLEGWRSHHPFLCTLNVGAATPIYRQSCPGFTAVREACVADGDPCCAYCFSWTG